MRSSSLGDCNMASDWKKAAAPYFPQLFIQRVVKGDIARAGPCLWSCAIWFMIMGCTHLLQMNVLIGVTMRLTWLSDWTIIEAPSALHSVQFSSVTQLCPILMRPHEPQHARPPCPSSTPGVYPTSHPLSWWCHPTISSSVIPFSSCPQSFPASGSFPMSQFFTSGGQSIGVSASISVLPMNTQDWSPLEWTGWISLQSKGLSRVFSNIIVQNHQFFGAQLSLESNSHIHTWLLEKPQPWLDGPLLAK